jgi:phosphatidylinositol-3-phosphatase
VRAALLAGLLAIAVASCGGSAATNVPIPSFDHVVVVMLENENQHSVTGNENAPRFNSFARHNAVLSHYGGIAHPSLPNYLGLISGSTHGIHTDCTTCLVSGRNLADTLEHAHLSWKTYAEGLPRPGFTGGFSLAGRYAKKHVPFLYFRDVVSKPARLQRIVPFRRFWQDLAAGSLPSFSLVVPNLCHDMHDCPVRQGDTWLGGFLAPLLRSPELENGVVFVVTDEPADDRPQAPVPALALGPLVDPGSRFARTTSHYGLLRTIEEAWGLPLLGHSAQARPITGIWR